MKKFSWQLPNCWKCKFLNFCFFPFSKFQITIVKNVIMDFESSQKVLLRHRIFYLHIFDNETAAFLIFLEICMEICILFLYFFRKKEALQPLFWWYIWNHLYHNVVHYANRNSSSINKLFFKLWIIEYVILFFSIYYLCLF